jgi:hypothetical protein
MPERTRSWTSLSAVRKTALGVRHAPAPRRAQAEAADVEAAAAYRQHVEALVFELAAQARFAVGDVRGLGDLARRRRYPAPELHADAVSLPRAQARRDHNSTVLATGPAPAPRATVG